MRQGVSDQGWLEALNPKWLYLEWCKRYCIWNTPTPPCSPGRYETGCCWRECVITWACPASAPSTGTTRVCVCVGLCVYLCAWLNFTPTIGDLRAISVFFSGSLETNSNLSLAKMVSLSFCALSVHLIPLRPSAISNADLCPCSFTSVICCHGNCLFSRVHLFHQWNSGNQKMQQQSQKR